MSTKSVQQQIEWRRNKVIELKSRGLSQVEIANELQVSKQLISSDVQYLREQAKEQIKKYVTDHLPQQYEVCLVALDAIIKRSFDILETSEDNREKLQAMELYKDTHMQKIALLSDATTIDSALNYVKSKQQQQVSSSASFVEDVERLNEEKEKEHKEKEKGESESDDDDDANVPAVGTQTHTVF